MDPGMQALPLLVAGSPAWSPSGQGVLGQAFLPPPPPARPPSCSPARLSVLQFLAASLCSASGQRQLPAYPKQKGLTGHSGQRP